MENKALLNLIRYFAYRAKEEGFQLSTIYIVKLLYLVDYFVAQKSNGKTVTGLTWKFRHYGPWSSDSFTLIENAIKYGYLKSQSYHSKIREDFNLLTYCEEDLEKDIISSVQKDFGFSIILEVNKVIKCFDRDSMALLNFVYEETEPMLLALPGEFLDFNKVSKPIKPKVAVQLIPPSKKKIKKLQEIINSFGPGSTKQTRSIKPTYDEVYLRGLESMDSEMREDLEISGQADVRELLPLRKKN